MEIRNAVCLVTGASSGIGLAIARRLQADGGRVVALGRDAAALEGIGERAVVCDLAEPRGWERAAEAAGAVDVLVNNAGAGWAGRFETIGPDDVERLVTLNLVAPIQLTRALLPGMLERGRGHVVNVASIVAYTGRGQEAVYAATKGGVVAFSESLRQELAGRGIGVTVVTPGIVDTEFFERRGSPYDRERPRPVAPERVADAVVSAIRSGRAEVFVPGWMTVPARMRGVAPGLFRRLIDRFG